MPKKPKKGKAPEEVLSGKPPGDSPALRDGPGRPCEYSQDKADIICARIAEGQSVRTICSDDDMPALPTFYRWIRQFPEFCKQYTRAKEDQADALAEQILDIADDGSNDWMERFAKDGENLGWLINGEAVQRSRLRVESRKWLAGKLRPRKYGESLKLQGDPEAPVELNHTHNLAAEVLKLLPNDALEKLASDGPDEP